jgi:AcrR family transcriptional regulator
MSNVIDVSRASDPRTRPALLAAARQLFYARGIAATGVDDIAEASGLTKPTLYRHFPSKEALLASYLDERNEQLTLELRGWIDAAPPRDRPRAVIDWLCDSIARPDFHGCAFVRSIAELPGDDAVKKRARERKRALLDAITAACVAAEPLDAVALAQQLALIVEGATTMAFVSGDARAASTAARELARIAFEASGVPAAR